ncbi:MAG: MBL fold metallo-hydrolase [Deltaproteobacteria bacterium]|nr:MBL fold metallo-hydrolase [Deltaproteobacteria bacterium]
MAKNPLNIKFLGATDTVTGSRFLLTHKNKRILIDCGMFQGLKELRLRNWNPFPVDPKTINAILLTHAHLDHSGYLPRLVKEGFNGPVYATHATRTLCSILLPDAAFLQEEDARFLNKHKLTKHLPALPLYSVTDANNSINHIQPVDWGKAVDIKGFTFRFTPVSHLLGASSIEITAGGKKILFSGDIGRSGDPILPERSRLKKMNVLILESTYGNRLHPPEDAQDTLAAIINQTVQRKGVILIPSFAIGRSQALLYIIHQLKQARKIPDIPVYLNSPMAIDATKAHYEFASELKMRREKLEEAFRDVNYVRSSEQSKQLNSIRVPAIILSSSGMLTGGRVLHHIKSLGPEPKNSIILVGYQAAGTRGELLVQGKDELKIHGQVVPIKARVHCLQNMSGHADYNGILKWLSECKVAPQKTFIVHGEKEASSAMSYRIKEKFGWQCEVPHFLEEVGLS